jgi:outer membrane protein assembly factor BamB
MKCCAQAARCARVIRIAGVLAVLAMLGGCDTVKSTYNSWFGAPAPSSKPAELRPIRAQVNPRILWRGAVGAAVKTVLFPEVSGGTVWVAGANGDIAGFNAANGGSVARLSAKQAIASGVAAGAATIAVGTPRGEILALDHTGKVLWKAQAPGETLAPPVIAGDRVIVRVGDGAIYAYDLASGKRRWAYQRAAPALSVRSHAGVVVSRSLVYAGFPGGRLIALSVDSGGVLWDSVVALPKGTTELERVADVTSPPVVDESRACAVAFQGRLACFDAARGTSIWTRDISSFSGLGADARNLYVSDDKSAVSALDKATGGSLWKQDKLAGRGVSRPLAMGRYVIVGDYQGIVHLLSREDGSFVGRIATDGSAIAAAPVALDLASFLVQTRNGGVFAISLE